MSAEEKKGIQELERTKSGEEIVNDLEVHQIELVIEIKEAQHLIDTSIGDTQEVAQEEMGNLQPLQKKKYTSDDDDSIGDMYHIPVATGNNNSDLGSAEMDEDDEDNDDNNNDNDDDNVDDDDEEEKESHQTDDGDSVGTGKEEDSNGDGDWRNEDNDNMSESSTKEDLAMIAVKGRESKEIKEER